jgi:hypothetical protein
VVGGTVGLGAAATAVVGTGEGEGEAAARVGVGAGVAVGLSPQLARSGSRSRLKIIKTKAGRFNFPLVFLSGVKLLKKKEKSWDYHKGWPGRWQACELFQFAAKSVSI